PGARVLGETGRPPGTGRRHARGEDPDFLAQRRLAGGRAQPPGVGGAAAGGAGSVSPALGRRRRGAPADPRRTRNSGLPSVVPDKRRKPASPPGARRQAASGGMALRTPRRAGKLLPFPSQRVSSSSSAPDSPADQESNHAPAAEARPRIAADSPS